MTACTQFNTEASLLVPSNVVPPHHVSPPKTLHFDATYPAAQAAPQNPMRSPRVPPSSRVSVPGSVYGWSPIWGLLLEPQRGLGWFAAISRALAVCWLANINGTPHIFSLLSAPTSTDNTASKRSPLGVTTAPDVAVDVALCLLNRVIDGPQQEPASEWDAYLAVRLAMEVSRCFREQIEGGEGGERSAPSNSNRAAVFTCALMRLSEGMPSVVRILAMWCTGWPHHQSKTDATPVIAPFSMIEVCCGALQQASYTSVGREMWVRPVMVCDESVLLLDILLELLATAVPAYPVRYPEGRFTSDSQQEGSLRCRLRIYTALQVGTRDLAVCRMLLHAGAIPLLLSDLSHLKTARRGTKSDSPTNLLCTKALGALAGVLQNMPRDRGCLAALRHCDAVTPILDALLIDVSGGEVDPHLQMLACKVILNLHEGDEASRAALRRVLAAAVAEQHIQSIVQSL